MKAISNASPDVLILMTAGNACSLGMREAGRIGLADDINAKGGALFAPSACRNYELFLKSAGERADGWWSVGGGFKDTTDAKFADDPFVSLLSSRLKADGLDPKEGPWPAEPLYVQGFAHGYPYVEALRIAAELPGGLTRANFMLAVRSIDISHPMLLDGIGFRLDGNADAFAVEGSSFDRFDARSKSWQTVGKVINIDGQTPNCNYGRYSGRCR